MRKIFQFAILLLIFATPALAQIGIDAPTAEADGGATTTITIPLTIATSTANNTELIVGCGIVDASSAAIVSTAVWKGSQSLTKVSSQPTGTGFNAPSGNPQNRTETWGLLLPTVGSGNVVVTLAAAPTGAKAESACSATVYVHVNQSLTPDAKNETSNGNAVQPNGTVTTNFAFDWVIDTIMNAGGVTNPQATAPSSRQWVNCIFPCGGFLNTFAGSFQVAIVAGTKTMTWAGINNAYSQNIIALKWDGVSATPVTYFISPTGNDSNTGLSTGVPWLTPNHPVNCGDFIQGAAGTYSYTSFRIGVFGPVSCPNANDLAMLGCIQFDQCVNLINASGHNAMTIGSYWGVRDWECQVTVVSTNQCFQAYSVNTTTPITHFAFINDICNQAGDDCFDAGSNVAATDYGIFENDIAYDGAQDNAESYSGIHPVGMLPIDTLPGTHLYIGNNFSWDNVDPNTCTGCGGGLPTDGQGISSDTNSLPQVVIDNNLTMFNGANGVQVFLPAAGNKTYFRHNTAYGNETGQVNANPCAEMTANSANNVEMSWGIAVTTAATACKVSGSAVTYWAIAASAGSTPVIGYNNYLYSAAGNNTTGAGATYPTTGVAANITGTNPTLANPVNPGAPSCSSFTSVQTCMASIIANFKPTVAAAKAYGYQTPSLAPQYDPLFPQWVCTVTNWPADAPRHCLNGSTIGPGAPSITGVRIH
jgi:hypothetical protein